MLRLLCTFLITAYPVFALELPNRPCPAGEAGSGKVLKVFSSNLTDGNSIELKRGNKYTFGMEFMAGENSEDLGQKIEGLIMTMRVEWKNKLSGLADDGCQYLEGNQTCPLVAGRIYRYVATLLVKEAYPAIPIDFQWALHNGAKKNPKNLACFRMHVKLI